ncbi:MAG: hypothetical protein ABWY18_09005 [Tardiphaga sp.]
MASDDLQIQTTPTVLTEVELALILAKTIETVKRDPEQLRRVVYDLARYKMHEQLSPAGPEHLKTSTGALEVAIQGVETFARTNKPMRAHALRRQFAPANDVNDDLAATALANQPIEPPAREFVPPRPLFATETPDSLRRGWIFGGVTLIGLAVAAIAIPRSHLFVRAPGKPVVVQQAAPVATPAVPEPPTPAAALPVQPAPLLPTSFGVHALSADRLTEISLLPSRAQDSRVALSSTVAPLTTATISDGNVSFIVYRREAQPTLPEGAEVRLIARVRRGISYDAAGKQVEAPDDGWYIRNISLPYRVVPIADHPDMFRIEPDKDGPPLSPGRYALVVKGQVYDFTIAGDVIDPRQCLERLTAANGMFVSPCAQP